MPTEKEISMPSSFVSHGKDIWATWSAAGSCFGHRCQSQACAEGVVGTNGTRTSIKSAAHREVTQISDVLCFLVFPNMALSFVTKIITTATSGIFITLILLPCSDQTLCLMITFNVFFLLVFFRCIQVTTCKRKQVCGGAVAVLVTLKCTDTLSMWACLGFGFCYILRLVSPGFANVLVILGHIPSSWGQVLCTLETGLGSNLRIIYSLGKYLYKTYFDSARTWWICMGFISSFISYLNGSM